MSITKFIERAGVQTIVYWGNPAVDAMRVRTFDDPVEITGRWEETQEMVRNNQGQEILAKARAWISQDVEEGGFLFLGTLDDLNSDEDPVRQDGALEIIAFTKKPRLGSSTEFLRKASLNVNASTTV